MRPIAVSLYVPIKAVHISPVSVQWVMSASPFQRCFCLSSTQRVWPEAASVRTSGAKGSDTWLTFQVKSVSDTGSEREKVPSFSSTSDTTLSPH